MTDIEIARNVKKENILKIARKLSLCKRDLFSYGNYIAKIKNLKKGKKNAKLILVTAINPTSAGNGKTTVSIGLADALSLKGKKVCLSLREPSLGPVFGIKGGATGGGKSQILPMEEINLHFTGDFHAITSANNLLSSLIDNHIFQGNELGIKEVVFKRCLDLNDRALREVTVSKSNNATPREDEFTITAASEIMAILSLAKDLQDLKIRLGNILVGYNKKGAPVFAKDLNAENAMAILLKDAIYPNLVQTIGKTPAVVHCGPFANIAHGCSSLIATNFALSNSDFAITEAGFGSDLGAEKFFNIVCREGSLKPSVSVLVATIPALKLHGGADKKLLKDENLKAVELGLENLRAHINNLKNFNIPIIVTLNKYVSDTEKEIEIVKNFAKSEMVGFAICDVWGMGGKGALELADEVVKQSKINSKLTYSYDLSDSVKTKIKKLAKQVYGTTKVVYSKEAEKSLKEIKKLGFENLPICVAKTQYSLSDNQKLLGAPKDFELTVRNIEIRSGAGFLVVLLGNMLLMPGLSKNPAAVNMTIDESGKIEGLF